MAEFNSISDLIEHVSSGVFAPECDDRLQEVVTFLEDHESAKGEITIKLILTQKGDHVAVLPTVKMKLPEPKFNHSFLFADNGGLATESPHQKKMNFDRDHTSSNITNINN